MDGFITDNKNVKYKHTINNTIEFMATKIECAEFVHKKQQTKTLKSKSIKDLLKAIYLETF